MGLNFSGRHYPSDIIMMYLRYYLHGKEFQYSLT